VVNLTGAVTEVQVLVLRRVLRGETLVAFWALNPKSKLAATRACPDTTPAAEFGVQGVDQHTVNHAMGRLVSRQARVEGK